jgi:hypothetical protein
MDVQLQTETWYNITWTFERSSTNATKFYVNGYLDGALTENRWGNNYDQNIHRNFGPGEEVADFLYDALGHNSGETAKFNIGSRYTTVDVFPHDVNVKDVSFYKGILTSDEIDSIVIAG